MSQNLTRRRFISLASVVGSSAALAACAPAATPTAATPLARLLSALHLPQLPVPATPRGAKWVMSTVMRAVSCVPTMDQYWKPPTTG